jgi:hypothetical protein
MKTQEMVHNGGTHMNSSKIMKSAEKLGADIKDVGTQVWDQAVEATDGAKCAAQDAIESGKKAVKDNLGDYETMIPKVKSYMCQNPIKSLLIGVGTVVIASRAFRS